MKINLYPTRVLQYVLGVDSEGRAGKSVPGGPIGPAPTLVSGITTTAPPGTPAEVDVVPTGDGVYRLDFVLPDGEDGATPVLVSGVITTLAPGSPATASLTPTGTPNQYALNLGLPQGTSGAGTGDVVGPATATSGSLARFSGTTGKLLADGAVIDTDVQSYSAKTAASSALTWAADLIQYFTGPSTTATTAFTTLARTIVGRSTGALIRGDIGAEALGLAAGITTYTASQTAVIGNAGFIVEMNVASANNFTIPPNSSVAFPVNTRIDLVQYGAGQTTIVAGAGVTLRSSGAKLKLTGQYSGASLYKRDTDEWVVIGDLAT